MRKQLESESAASLEAMYRRMADRANGVPPPSAINRGGWHEPRDISQWPLLEWITTYDLALATGLRKDLVYQSLYWRCSHGRVEKRRKGLEVEWRWRKSDD